MAVLAIPRQQKRVVFYRYSRSMLQDIQDDHLWSRRTSNSPGTPVLHYVKTEKKETHLFMSSYLGPFPRASPVSSIDLDTERRNTKGVKQGIELH